MLYQAELRPVARRPAQRTARAPGQGGAGVGGWLSALWLHVPLPVIGYLDWLVTLLVLRGRASRRNAVAAANVRHGLNWCLTYGAVWLAWFAVYLAEILTHIDPVTGSAESGFLGRGGFLSLYLMPVPLLLGGLLALVNLVTGSLRASRGEVFKGYLATPFLGERETVETF